MSLLTAHTIIQELGSLENFCHLTPFQRKQRYEELIGAEKLVSLPGQFHVWRDAAYELYLRNIPKLSSN